MNKHIHGGDVYRYRNYLDFSSNCNPLGTPRSVREAICGAAGLVEHYPDVRCEELKNAIAEYEQVPADHIFCGNGAAEVIFSLCLAGKPQTALLVAPTFAEYEQALESVGCRSDFYPLKKDQGFAADDGFLEEIRKKSPDIIFFCNPNNPTGVLTPRTYLEKMLKICTEKGILLVVDECFLDFAKRPEDHTLKSFLGEKVPLFLLKAFTKRYAMAGVRLGYGLSGQKELLNRMDDVTQPWNVSSLAQAAGIAALRERDYVERGRKLIFCEREYLADALAGLGLRVYDPGANYLFFQGPAGLAERMKEHRILIRDCSNYRNLGPGCYRIAVRTHEENQRLVGALTEERKLWQEQL